jgi:hypothetical protein
MPVQGIARHVDDAERLQERGRAVGSIESEAAGDQYQAVGVDATLCQCVRNVRGAPGTPALAREKHGSADGIVQDEPAADELRDGCDIAQRAVELIPIGRAGWAAESRADRIDHDQIGRGKPGVRIVDQLRALQKLRARDVEMQPSGRRSGPTVPYEHHRTLRFGALPPVGDALLRSNSRRGPVCRIEHVAVRFAVLHVADGDAPSLRRIRQFPAADLYVAPGNDGRIVGRIGRCEHRRQPQQRECRGRPECAAS